MENNPDCIRMSWPAFDLESRLPVGTTARVIDDYVLCWIITHPELPNSAATRQKIRNEAVADGIFNKVNSVSLDAESLEKFHEYANQWEMEHPDCPYHKDLLWEMVTRHAIEVSTHAQLNMPVVPDYSGFGLTSLEEKQAYLDEQLEKLEAWEKGQVEHHLCEARRNLRKATLYHNSKLEGYEKRAAKLKLKRKKAILKKSKVLKDLEAKIADFSLQLHQLNNCGEVLHVVTL